MTNLARIGLVLLVLLGAGLLTTITDHTGITSRNLDRSPVEIRTSQTATVIETVDVRNGNVHLQIPILTTHQKPTVPRSGH